MMTNIMLNCVLIFLARAADVSLGTLRTLTVVRGNRLAAWLLGFVEILIWVPVVSKVIQSVRDTPIHAVFYAAAFATGGYVGMTIDPQCFFVVESVDTPHESKPTVVPRTGRRTQPRKAK